MAFSTVDCDDYWRQQEFMEVKRQYAEMQRRSMQQSPTEKPQTQQAPKTPKSNPVLLLLEV